MESAQTPSTELTSVDVPGGTLAVEVVRSRTEPLLLDCLAHDLVGGRVRLSGEALIADAADIFFGPSKWQQLQVPTRFLTAEWSVGAGSAPAYPAEAVRSFQAELDALVTVRPVPGVDHAAVIMSVPGAQASAELINEALTAGAYS